MISNFTTLYSMYARSHFYFAAELLLLTGGWAVLARNPPGMEVWPGVLYAGSLLLSPWLFSPASFRFLSIRESYVEFIMWLDDRPGIPLTVGKGLVQGLARGVDQAAARRSGRHAILMLLSRHVPVRVVVYLCCASALVVDAFPNSRPAHRALILAEARALFLTFGVLYYFVVDHRLLRRGILPQSIWAHFAFCWTVRVGTFILYYLAIQFLYATGDGATNPRGGNELGPAGDTPKNLFLLFIARAHRAVVHRARARAALSSEEEQEHRRSCGTHRRQPDTAHRPPRPLLAPLLDLGSAFREADTWVGTALFLTLKVIAVLPIAYVHSKLLFNEGYAASLARVARSRALVAEVHALVSLRAGFFFHLLLRVLSSFGRLLCVLCMPWRRGEEEEQPSFEPTVAGLPLSLAHLGPLVVVRPLRRRGLAAMGAALASHPLRLTDEIESPTEVQERSNRVERWTAPGNRRRRTCRGSHSPYSMLPPTPPPRAPSSETRPLRRTSRRVPPPLRLPWRARRGSWRRPPRPPPLLISRIAARAGRPPGAAAQGLSEDGRRRGDQAVAARRAARISGSGEALGRRDGAQQSEREEHPGGAPARCDVSRDGRRAARWTRSVWRTMHGSARCSPRAVRRRLWMSLRPAPRSAPRRLLARRGEAAPQHALVCRGRPIFAHRRV